MIRSLPVRRSRVREIDSERTGAPDWNDGPRSPIDSIAPFLNGCLDLNGSIDASSPSGC